VSFYVSHMTPHKRSRIHKGECPDCNFGRGQPGQDKTGCGATGWDGPFESLAAAEDFMRKAFPRFTDTGKCRRCKPGVI
jgi:hypothetical protein